MNSFYVVKLVATALLVVLVSELAKRSTLFGAIVASLPLVSLLAFLWIYYESKDVERISALSQSIFWLVLPSLFLFLALPILLGRGYGFFLSLGLSCAITIAGYLLTLLALRQFGIEL